MGIYHQISLSKSESQYRIATERATTICGNPASVEMKKD